MASRSILATACVLFLTLLSTCLAINVTNCTMDSECGSIAGVCNMSGVCECNETFPDFCVSVNNGSGLCALRNCYQFVEGDDLCRNGEFSRTTALLLSIFLINFGAANFYIRQYALAAPQIVLGLLLIVFQFGSCGASCTRKETTSKLCIICCICNSIISLTVFAWWLADLIIFATNSRMDGSGCPLYT